MAEPYNRTHLPHSAVTSAERGPLDSTHQWPRLLARCRKEHQVPDDVNQIGKKPEDRVERDAFNTAFASSVLLACASLTATVDVGPFTPWRSVSNSGLCVQPVSPSDGSPLVVRACDGNNLSQKWSWLRDGNTIYRLQNGASAIPPTVKLGECTNSDGSGRTVSNAQFDSVTPLPNVVQLKSHIHFITTNGCVDIVNSNVVMETCNPTSLTQKWIVGE
ncbi:hypothetical protein C8J57DRAFT_1713313 [Mycena rebaudengoi]|nr:hypothetical protein C8J57DRAFT_1713313 [Mycena rebaudengoi]